MSDNLFPACGEDADGFVGVDYGKLLKRYVKSRKSNANSKFDYREVLKNHTIEKKSFINEPKEIEPNLFCFENDGFMKDIETHYFKS
jgi:hypothetical protein